MESFDNISDEVGRAICEKLFGNYSKDEADSAPHSVSGQAKQAAHAAIDAYHEYIRKHSS